MQKKILEDIADQLRQSGEYRIILKGIFAFDRVKL